MEFKWRRTSALREFEPSGSLPRTDLHTIESGFGRVGGNRSLGGAFAPGVLSNQKEEAQWD